MFNYLLLKLPINSFQLYSVTGIVYDVSFST